MFRAPQALSAAVVLILAALVFGPVHAQAPTQPADPAPSPSQPGQPAAPAPSPSQPAQPADPTPSQSQPAQPADPFGEEVQVAAKTIIFFKGNATWDTAFETLVDSFKSVFGFLEKEGITAAGPAMTIYLTTDDTGFDYRAAVPIPAPPANPPRGDIEMGESPAGKMLKFVHRGSYDSMDTTYEAITNYLDTKQLEAQDTFIEEYVTNPVTTAEDQLVINVLVPVK